MDFKAIVTPLASFQVGGGLWLDRGADHCGVFFAGATHRTRSGQNRHQCDDTVDGTDSGGAVGRGDVHVRRTDQAVAGASALIWNLP